MNKISKLLSNWRVARTPEERESARTDLWAEMKVVLTQRKVLHFMMCDASDLHVRAIEDLPETLTGVSSILVYD